MRLPPAPNQSGVILHHIITCFPFIIILEALVIMKKQTFQYSDLNTPPVNILPRLVLSNCALSYFHGKILLAS